MTTDSIWRKFWRGWKKKSFEKDNKDFIELCDTITWGTLSKQKGSTAYKLAHIVDESEPHKYTIEQIKQKIRGKSNSRFWSLVHLSASPLEQSVLKQKVDTKQKIIPCF